MSLADMVRLPLEIELVEHVSDVSELIRKGVLLLKFFATA
jgi:hypothetical protein